MYIYRKIHANMKRFILPGILMFCLSLTSCRQDSVINFEVPVVRDYQTDVQVLSRFVDVDKTTGEYYINENKRTTALSYLNDQDWLELQKVNPVNYNKYKNELATLNRQLAEYAHNPNISMIVYSTYGGDIYVRDLDNDCSLHIEKAEGRLFSTRTTRQSFVFGKGTNSQATFNGGSSVQTTVRINSSGYYLYELICNPNGDLPVGDNSTGLILSGTDFDNSTYTWISDSPNTLWNFKGTAKSVSFGTTAQIEFSE